MELFSILYGTNNHALFIPPPTLQGWSSTHQADLEWEKEAMNSGKVKEVFAIVFMEQHWGAFHIDLIRRKIQFGDSLNRSIPNNAVNGIRRWLEISGQDL